MPLREQLVLNLCFLFQLRIIGEKIRRFVFKVSWNHVVSSIYISFNASSLIHSWEYENGRDFYKKNAMNKQKTTIFMFQGPLEPSSRSWIFFQSLILREVILCNLYLYPNTYHQYIILHHFWNTTVVFSEILTFSFFIFFSIDDR